MTTPLVRVRFDDGKPNGQEWSRSEDYHAFSPPTLGGSLPDFKQARSSTSNTTRTKKSRKRLAAMWLAWPCPRTCWMHMTNSTNKNEPRGKRDLMPVWKSKGSLLWLRSKPKLTGRITARRLLSRCARRFPLPSEGLTRWRRSDRSRRQNCCGKKGSPTGKGRNMLRPLSKLFLALSLVPASALPQERWTRIEKTDALRGTKSTRFTLEGKFLEAPQQSKMSSPTFVVDCDPSKWRDNRHQHGKLLDAYIVVGAVLDTKVDLDRGRRTGVINGLNVQYRLDDGKVQFSISWSHSTDFSAIFLSVTLGILQRF